MIMYYVIVSIPLPWKTYNRSCTLPSLVHRRLHCSTSTRPPMLSCFCSFCATFGLVWTQRTRRIKIRPTSSPQWITPELSAFSLNICMYLSMGIVVFKCSSLTQIILNFWTSSRGECYGSPPHSGVQFGPILSDHWPLNKVGHFWTLCQTMSDSVELSLTMSDATEGGGAMVSELIGPLRWRSFR